WFVPHDPRGLFDALGGNATVVPRLDRFFTQINAGGRDPYSYIGNEPGFNTPWLFNWAGAPAHTQEVVHRAIAEGFSTAPGGLPGNDDLGATSSWLVWALLGMYPELPGTGGVTLASPSFSDVMVHLAGGKTLHVTATGLPERYVQSLQIDGQASSSLWLPIATILGGTTLDFAVGPAPGGGAHAPRRCTAVVRARPVHRFRRRVRRLRRLQRRSEWRQLRRLWLELLGAGAVAGGRHQRQLQLRRRDLSMDGAAR